MAPSTPETLYEFDQLGHFQQSRLRDAWSKMSSTERNTLWDKLWEVGTLARSLIGGRGRDPSQHPIDARGLYFMLLG